MAVVAALGLGAMGKRMAVRLLRAGHDLVVWNRTSTACDELSAMGARIAESPREAVHQVDVALVMVTDDAASSSVWMDTSRGALSGLRRETIAVEMSSLSPAWALELAHRLSKRARAFVDAPVVGSRSEAETGELAVLAGGEADVVAELSDVFSAVACSVYHLGPNGTGAWMKLMVNALLGIQIAALGELTGVMRASPVDPSLALHVLASLPVASPVLRSHVQLIEARSFEAQFPVSSMGKNLRYIVEAAERSRAEIPVASLACEVFARAEERGFGEENINAVVKLYE